MLAVIALKGEVRDRSQKTRRRIEVGETEGKDGEGPAMGSGSWTVLGSFVALLIASFVLACGCFRYSLCSQLTPLLSFAYTVASCNE